MASTYNHWKVCLAHKGEFEKLAPKYEELKERVGQYLEDEQQQEKRMVPIAKAPRKPTQEQWERDHATHTHTIRVMV